MISVVLATYNEERNLTRCLDSIQDIADEIVIVDGSSTDNTRSIANQYNAVVIKTSNKPIFHINKQIAMDKASHQLVFQLDADEVVDDQLRNFILQINLTLEETECMPVDSAWWVKRKNNFLGHWLKKGGQYPDPVIRLFIKGKAKLPQKSVHEQMKVDGKIGWAEGHILHFSNPRFKDYWRKLQTYTQLEADKITSSIKKFNVYFYLQYLILKPAKTFFLIFIRHKGFVDGFYGFLFAFLSAMHFPIILVKVFKKTWLSS